MREAQGLMGYQAKVSRYPLGRGRSPLGAHSVHHVNRCVKTYRPLSTAA